MSRDPRIAGYRVPGSQVPGLRVPGLRIPGLRLPGPGSQVLDLGYVRKNGLIRKIRLISKFMDVTAWLTKNYNTHIPQYLTNLREPDNEIWSVNKTSQEKYFSLKIMQKMRQGN